MACLKYSLPYGQTATAVMPFSPGRRFQSWEVCEFRYVANMLTDEGVKFPPLPSLSSWSVVIAPVSQHVSVKTHLNTDAPKTRSVRHRRTRDSNTLAVAELQVRKAAAMLARLMESQTGFFHQRLKKESLKGRFKGSCRLIGRLRVLRSDWFECRHRRKLIIAAAFAIPPRTLSWSRRVRAFL